MILHDIEAARRDMQQGDLSSAETKARLVIQKTGAMHPEAVHILASIALCRGQSATAIALIGRILQQPDGGRPASLESRLHQTMGRALMKEGHDEAARAAFSIAVASLPEEAAAQGGMGEVLLRLNRPREALSSLKKAVALAPSQAALWQFLAQAQQKLGMLSDAAQSWERIVELCPHDGAAHANYGALLFELRRIDAASISLEKALALGSATAETLNNLALVRNAQGAVQDACTLFRKAYQIAPMDRDIYINYASALYESGAYSKAESLLDDLSQGRLPDKIHERIRFNRAALYLGRNEWEKGWHAFEARRGLLPAQVMTPLEKIPLWDGEKGDIPIALYGEQGMGDLIQFLRFLPEALARRPVRLDVSPDVMSFIQERMSLPQGRLCAPREPVGAQQSLLSLPYILKHFNAPDPMPYCRPLAPYKERVVGISWAGNPAYIFDRRRSIPVDLLEPLQEVTGVRFVSLQSYQNAPSWMETVPLGTLSDVAHAVECCELVISVDTFIAHVAGALGRPLWLLNRKGGDWRWQGGPWYHHLRIFQAGKAAPPYESWPEIIEQVVQALREVFSECNNREAL